MSPWSPPYEVLKQAVPPIPVARALEAIHRDMFDWGISRREMLWWQNTACWFPHLRNDPRITSLANYVGQPGWGERAEPQILLAFPDPRGGRLEPHVDQAPDGRVYSRLAGIALSDAPLGDGLHVWPSGVGKRPVPIDLQPGDVIVLNPDLPHCGGYNRTGRIRYAVYFRWLAP